MSAVESIARVVDTVDYIRVTTGGSMPADGATWLPCTDLVSNPDTLRAAAGSVRTGRGLDRDDVAMSLLVQGYAYRIASIAIGAWLADGVVLDLDPARMSVRIHEHRPNAVHFVEPTVAGSTVAGSTVADLHAQLVDGHLARVVDNARVACRIGGALLWSNVGSSCAASFGAFMGPWPERRPEIRDRAAEFFAAARPELARSGQVVAVGSVWAWERQACCLWYQTADGDKCSDCSLWSDDERQARYQRVLATDPDSS